MLLRTHITVPGCPELSRAGSRHSSESSASTRSTVARETPSADASVVAGSPLACIRRANAVFDSSSAFGRPWTVLAPDVHPSSRTMLSAQLQLELGQTAEWC